MDDVDQSSVRLRAAGRGIVQNDTHLYTASLDVEWTSDRRGLSTAIGWQSVVEQMFGECPAIDVEGQRLLTKRDAADEFLQQRSLGVCGLGGPGTPDLSRATHPIMDFAGSAPSLNQISDLTVIVENTIQLMLNNLFNCIGGKTPCIGVASALVDELLRDVIAITDAALVGMHRSKLVAVFVKEQPGEKMRLRDVRCAPSNTESTMIGSCSPSRIGQHRHILADAFGNRHRQWRAL